MFFTKINLKWITELRVKTNKKLLEENTGTLLNDLGCGDHIKTQHQRHNPEKNNDKLDFIMIKSFYSVKDKVVRLSRPIWTQNGRKYLQKTHLIEDCYTKYTMSI